MEGNQVPPQVVGRLAAVAATRMTVAVAVLGAAATVGLVGCSIALASGALDEPQERIGLAVLAFPTAWLAMLCRYCWRTRRHARRVAEAASDPRSRWVLRRRAIIGVDQERSFCVSRRARALLSTPPRATVVK